MASTSGKSTSTTDSLSSSSLITSTTCPILPKEPINENTRADIWAACLNISKKNIISEILNCEDMDNIQNLSLIVQYSSIIAEQLAATESDVSYYRWEIMRILSYHSMVTKIDFDPMNGWQDLLEPIMTLHVSETMKYEIFSVILNYYIPKNEDYVSILRLLLIYHDPQLYTFLRSKELLLTDYPFPWINRLFAAFFPTPSLLVLWDRYLIERNRFLIFFLSVALMISFRDKILELRNDDKRAIVHTLWTLPIDLTVEDVSELYVLAYDLKSKTPLSYLEKLCPIIFDNKEDENSILNSPCWTVTVEEFVKNLNKTSLSAMSKNVKYFSIDCRSQEEFDAGHLVTAYPVDNNTIIENPVKFGDTIDKLFDLHRTLLSGNFMVRHFCFIDSGQDNEKSYTKVIVKRCIQKHIKYLNILAGGYVALHQHFESRIDDYFANHDIRRCLVCKENEKSRAMKQRRSRLISQGQELIGLLKPSTSVYSIDEEIAGSSRMIKSKSMFETPFKIVSITKWLEDPQLVQYFKCQEVDSSKYHDCYLLITRDHLIVLREIPDRDDAAEISVKRPLRHIIQINAKQINKNIIVFKYFKEAKLNDLAVKNRSEFLFSDESKIMQFISSNHFKSLLMLNSPRKNI